MRLLNKFIMLVFLFLAIGIAYGQSRPVIDDSALRQPLEHYELSSLRYIKFHGFLFWKSAEILSPDGKTYTIRRGTYMGKNLGRVESITNELIELHETIPDGSGGCKEMLTEIRIE